MGMNVRKNHELRMRAFDSLQELKQQNLVQYEIIVRINEEFSIPKGTLYDWYSGRNVPRCRAGKVRYKPELFYVLGALLGDGCIYHWKKLNRRIINIIGDRAFASKYANKLSSCTPCNSKAYINRSKNIWFVNVGNIELFFLFKAIRSDLNKLNALLESGNSNKNALQFIEGFFDAEGCVKIIKEKVRKTPKICLDFTNTTKEILDIVQNLLEKYLNIEARYSIQKADAKKNRKAAYHLRIYKKEYIRIFFENIHTTKLIPRKVSYVNNWLNNGK